MSRQAAGNRVAQSSDLSIVDRREFLNRIPLTLGILSSAAIWTGEIKARTEKEVLARTTYGRVRGTSVNGVNVFKGIPYAGSPGTPGAKVLNGFALPET